MAVKNKKILIIIGGGIAAYKSLDLIRLLRKNNNKVKNKFLTYEGLSNKISAGGELNQFEYGTIKSCLLGANSGSTKTAPVDMAEAYEVFLDQYTL